MLFMFLVTTDSCSSQMTHLACNLFNKVRFKVVYIDLLPTNLSEMQSWPYNKLTISPITGTSIKEDVT